MSRSIVCVTVDIEAFADYKYTYKKSFFLDVYEDTTASLFESKLYACVRAFVQEDLDTDEKIKFRFTVSGTNQIASF